MNSTLAEGQHAGMGLSRRPKAKQEQGVLEKVGFLFAYPSQPIRNVQIILFYLFGLKMNIG